MQPDALCASILLGVYLVAQATANVATFQACAKQSTSAQVLNATNLLAGLAILGYACICIKGA